MNILDTIVRDKKEEIAASRRKISLAQLSDAEHYHRATNSISKSIAAGTGIIAEFKRRSPSKGIINSVALPETVARDYEKYGAGGISVLTDRHFGGCADDLLAVRRTVKLPLLRKDFMVDEYQFHEAKAWGADAVLLIAACLSPAQVHEFTGLAHGMDLEVLLEIHSEEELGHICEEVDVVGINNRNLKDFKVDLQHSVKLRNQLPDGLPAVAESGIYTVDDFKFLKEKGFDGFLMGEYFMKSNDPGRRFAEFVSNINS